MNGPGSARGFIALMSAVVISAILLGVAATLSQGVFFTRFDGLYAEYHRISRTLAESCIQAALLKLADGYDYLVPNDQAYDSARGSVSVPLGTLYDRVSSCELLGPTTTPSEVAHARDVPITVRASFLGSYTNLVATAHMHDPNIGTGTALPPLTLDSIREIP